MSTQITKTTECDHDARLTTILDVPCADFETGIYKGCFDRVLCWKCGDYAEEEPTPEANCKHKRTFHEL